VYHCPSVLIGDVKTRSAQLPVRNWNFGVQRLGTMYISLISGRVIRASLTERPIALPPETVLERNHANPTISRGPSL